VHFEFFGDIGAAIAREKEIKGWRREKKIWLIQRNNLTWPDLAEKIPHQYQVPNKERKADPSPPFAKSRRPGSG
jgi:hypothetical protein